MKMICSTTRLYLREFEDTDKDADFILEMNSQPEVLKYLHERTLTSTADAKQILREHILPQYPLGLGRWAVHRKADYAFLGWCGLKQRAERNNEIDLGYRFLPAHWGQGVAYEAAEAVIQYGLNELKLPEINACAHIENMASLRILEKLGMTYIREDIIDDCPVKCFRLTNSPLI
jgi:ribosomal-protein-alanine N-acetyltransferase